MTTFRPALAGLLAFLAAGCGPSFLAPVRGKLVSPDGHAVTGMRGGQVVFEGTAPDGKGYSSSGPVQADGTFELTTLKPGDGAVVGKNRVMIEPPAGAADGPPVRVLAGKYESVETSGLEVEVKAGKNDVTLTVEPARKAKPPAEEKP